MDPQTWTNSGQVLGPIPHPLQHIFVLQRLSESGVSDRLEMEERAPNDAHDARLPAPIGTALMIMMRLASPCEPPMMLTMLVYRLSLITSEASTTTVRPPVMLMRSLIGYDWAPNGADDAHSVM